MKERTQTGGQAISGLFTMLLFLVFVLCALFSVLMGSRVYENITKRSDENFSGTTALSYIANKIRQGDREDAVDIIEVDGTPCLQMKTVDWGWRMDWRSWNVTGFPWKKMETL